MRNLGLAFRLAILMLLASTVVVFESPAQGGLADWANDPRSNAPSTRGLEDLLPRGDGSYETSGFGEVLGCWTWEEIGIPDNHIGAAGVSIDYPYLYLCNRNNHRVYVVDISNGAPDSVTTWFVAPGEGMLWGAGMDNEQQLWVGDIVYPGYSWAYEMTTYPPDPSPTGFSFDAYQGDFWMADMSDNVPHDTLFIVRVGGNNNIYAIHEPTGTVGRSFGHPAWNYISQRAISYNDDDTTLFVGGWNSDSLWEVSITDGTPLPGRSFYSDWASGAAYQSIANGGPYLWVQEQDTRSTLCKHHVPPKGSCEPVEPWDPRTQGYWRRQCKRNPHEDICVFIDSVHILVDLFDSFDYDSVCDLMNVDPPKNDMCRKARRQFMALLLNVASGKLARSSPISSGKTFCCESYPSGHFRVYVTASRMAEKWKT